MGKVNLKMQLQEFEKANYLESDGSSNTGCYNFYDWFCKDSSLQNKAEKLFKATKRFCEKFNIDTDKYYVFFKNNCPMIGPLYDDFRICDAKTGKVIYNVIPKSGHSGNAEIYSKEHGFQEPLYEGKNLREIYKQLK